MNDNKQNHWIISVASWGTLKAKGTEEQAEEWRRHKARWEGCIARKRLATKEEIENGEFESLEDLL